MKISNIFIISTYLSYTVDNTTSKMSFNFFSYFEAFNTKYFVSKYPSVDTTPYLGANISDKLFETLSFSESELKLHLMFLKSQNFGFKDFISWLLPDDINTSQIYNASEICLHLNNLTIISLEHTEYATVACVSSPTFGTPLKVRLCNETLPQKAIDTIPCFVSDNKIVTTIGYKKRSREVTIVFSDGSNFTLLETGMYGYINGGGEHCNALKEGTQLNAIISEIKDSINNDDIICPYKYVEIANRCLIEEVGLDVEHDAHAYFYVFGISNSPRRDPRYVHHVFKFNETETTFGYDRPSESILVTSVIMANPPEVLPDPSDLEEIQAGSNRLVDFDELVTEFRHDGKYKPAFNSHTQNLKLLAKKINVILTDLNSVDVNYESKNKKLKSS